MQLIRMVDRVKQVSLDAQDDSSRIINFEDGILRFYFIVQRVICIRIISENERNINVKVTIMYEFYHF